MSGPEPDGTVEVRACELGGVEARDKGPARLRGDLHQQLDQVDGASRVQRRNRLVREHCARRLHQDPRDGHALLLAAGEVRGSLLRLVSDSDARERFEALDSFSGGDQGEHRTEQAPLPQLPRHHIVHDGQMRDEVELLVHESDERR